MVLLIYSQNIDITSPNTAAPTSSNLYRKLFTLLLLTLFRLDLSLFKYKKLDKKPVSEFL